MRAILPAWGLEPEAPLSLLNISENATYLAPGDGARPDLVLRVYRPGYHSQAEILSELAWIESLCEAGIVATPRLVPTAQGSRLARFGGAGKARFCAAFERMSGREPGDSADRAHWFGHIGETSARLHEHARRWLRPGGFLRKSWTFETMIGRKAFWGDWRAAPGLDAGGRAVLERAEARLAADCAAFGHSADRFGLIHGDLRAANLLVDGDRLGVIDFDDCGFGWFGFDFAAAVSFIEHEPAVPDLMAAWLDGYRRVAAFPVEQERALPMLVMLRRMQLTAWIASHAETPTAEGLQDSYAAGTVELAQAYLQGSRMIRPW